MNCGRRHDVWLPAGRYLDCGTLALFGLLFKRGQRIAMALSCATATGTGRVARAARDGYTVVASSLLRLVLAGAVARWDLHHRKAPPFHGARRLQSFPPVILASF
jgi:hypothetical protein